MTEILIPENVGHEAGWTVTGPLWQMIEFIQAHGSHKGSELLVLFRHDDAIKPGG